MFVDIAMFLVNILFNNYTLKHYVFDVLNASKVSHIQLVI